MEYEYYEYNVAAGCWTWRDETGKVTPCDSPEVFETWGRERVPYSLVQR